MMNAFHHAVQTAVVTASSRTFDGSTMSGNNTDSVQELLPIFDDGLKLLDCASCRTMTCISARSSYTGL